VKTKHRVVCNGECPHEDWDALPATLDTLNL
jgi:hypothetical protein